jgi:hypothetical protein
MKTVERGGWNGTGADALASMVSSVTGTMCGTTFEPADPSTRGESLCGRMVLLPIEGARQVSILLAFDVSGGRTLAASMFGMASEEITQDLADDAVRELLNMVAGQVSRALGLDSALGLARATTLAELAQHGGFGIEEGVLLRSTGNVDLRLWIFERGSQAGSEREAAPEGGLFRSLLRAIASRS